MTDAQQALDDALTRCDFLRSLLKEKKSKQVWADDERSTIKATCFAWINNQRPKIAAQLDTSILGEVDSKYGQLLNASDKAASRSRYHTTLKKLRVELIDLRAKQMSASVASTALRSVDLPPSFAPLIPDPQMQRILERRWQECVACLAASAPMAATVMMGGLLEGLLLARINREQNQAPVYKAAKAPKDKKTGQTLPLKDWMLKGFIDVAHELKWISQSAKDVGAVLGEYRNYIHPQKELSHGVVITDEDASILWAVAKTITMQLLK